MELNLEMRSLCILKHDDGIARVMRLRGSNPAFDVHHFARPHLLARGIHSAMLGVARPLSNPLSITDGVPIHVHSGLLWIGAGDGGRVGSFNSCPGAAQLRPSFQAGGLVPAIVSALLLLLPASGLGAKVVTTAPTSASRGVSLGQDACVPSHVRGDRDRQDCRGPSATWNLERRARYGAGLSGPSTGDTRAVLTAQAAPRAGTSSCRVP